MKPEQKKKNLRIPKQEAPEIEKGPLLSKPARKTLEKYKDENVMFSWQFFDRSHALFNCGGTDFNWFLSCVDTLKTVSEMKIDKFLIHRDKPLRVHQHNFDELEVRYNLNSALFEQVEDSAYQFALSTANGRIHGFVIDNVFYVVWLDPLHNLYPMERHGGVKYCDPPDDCYSCLEKKASQLEHDNMELMQQYFELEREFEDFKYSQMKINE